MADRGNPVDFRPVWKSGRYRSGSIYTEFGSHIAEAHHIDYFVNGLNNDVSNQMVVCPNHHSIIHDTNLVFDRRRRMYVYSNGIEQRLVLNKHL